LGRPVDYAGLTASFRAHVNIASLLYLHFIFACLHLLPQQTTHTRRVTGKIQDSKESSTRETMRVDSLQQQKEVGTMFRMLFKVLQTQHTQCYI